MDIKKEIEALKAGDASIIDDSFKFRRKLDLGDETYDYLNNAKNFLDFLKAIGVGIGTGGVASGLCG